MKLFFQTFMLFINAILAYINVVNDHPFIGLFCAFSAGISLAAAVEVAYRRG